MTVANISNMTVRYGAKVALNDLSVEIPDGCVGLLGPNGAGKTTLLKTLLGFLTPASGSASVLGLNIATDHMRIRQKVGLMPEQDCHIPGLNAVSFVAYAGELAGMPARHALRRAHEVLEYCGLGEARYRPVETYSTGMKQRIKLAQAIVHGPSLLILDEPTNGLDPEGREDMLRLMRDVSHGKGLSVLVSSHLLPDVEKVCDSVVVINNGALVAQGTVASLRNVQGSAQFDIELAQPSDSFASALERAGLPVTKSLGSRYRVQLSDGQADPARIAFAVAHDTGAQIRGFIPTSRTLEDIFLEAVE